ncbi:MAG: hypothetical protein V1676_04485 [Candidatus Diapherotrites archaeon]
MDKRLVLAFAALVLVPTVLAAEQCAWFKGNLVGTTYDLLTNSGLANAPHSIDSYTNHANYALFFSNERGIVYGYNKTTKQWESGKISDYYPARKIDAIIWHTSDVTTVISGMFYWYRLGPAWEGKTITKAGKEWKGPIEIEATAMNFWKPRVHRPEFALTYPAAPEVATSFFMGHGEQLYIAENGRVNGEPGIHQWWTGGGNAKYWFYSFKKFSELSLDLKNMTQFDAVGMYNGRGWLIFGQGNCVPLVRDPNQDTGKLNDVIQDVIGVPQKDIVECTEGQAKEYSCPDGTKVPWCTCMDKKWNCILSPENACPKIDVPACEVQFTDTGFHGTNKTVTVKVQGGAAAMSKAISGYYNFNDPETCTISGNTVACPCTQTTNDIRYVSVTLKTEAAGGVLYAVDAAGNKVCKAESDPKYGVATYHFLDEDGLKRCNPEQVMADRITVNKVNARFHKLVANYVLQGLELKNIGTATATVRDISVLYPEMLVKPIDVSMQCSDSTSADYCSFRQPAVTATPVPMVERYALTAKVMAEPEKVYEIPVGKVRPLEVAWDPSALIAGRPHDISVVIAFLDGSSLTVPIPDVVAEGCTDSDGGDKYGEKGSATGKNPNRPSETISAEDYCDTSGNKPTTTLREYYCDGEYLKDHLANCDNTSGTNRCSDGACVK